MDRLAHDLARSPAYDADAVDALPHYKRSVGVLIADDDPNPNDVKRLLLNTQLGIWEVVLSDEGIWEISGEAVGPDVARSCLFAQSYHAAAEDLEEHQGPDARTGYDLPGYSA